MKTIIIPGDGASNIKISVYDIETLETVFETSTITSVGVVEGYKCKHIRKGINRSIKGFSNFRQISTYL